MFWSVEHCSRDEVSRVIILLYSRELIPMEQTLHVIKQSATPKRVTEKWYGVMVTPESWQLVKCELKLSDGITGGALSSNCELVEGVCIARNLQSSQVE